MINYQPYAKLAEIYDRVMNHVNYDEWAQYISSIFNRFGIKVKNILEIACGTGSLALLLQRHGYNITGMDLSPDMLKVAESKFKQNGLPLHFFAADMTSIPMKKEFDAVLCMYDSINYLKDPAEFKKAVEEISKVTKYGSLFIFDVCTLKNSQIFFSHNSISEDLSGIKYERKCCFNETKRIQENFFIIEQNGERFIETHFQKIYMLEEIIDMISYSSFDIIGIFDDMSFSSGSEDSERVHFILQKKI
ncbi:MAG TPA: class I SAM-dependent methyltransferase [bacterium]|nr:class I SAM-dependent methyltransferase [bacterium]